MISLPAGGAVRPELIAAIGIALFAGAGCASPAQERSAKPADHYLKWVTFEMLGNENVLLRWPERKMPLRVHLPAAPAEIFEDADAITESVRDGVLDWADVVAPGVPSFVFVESAGDADIPVVWASKPDGDWYIAHCAWDIGARARRFGVSRILVTGRFGDEVADLHDVHQVMLHEMGHALGFGGHSPDPADIMYRSISGRAGVGLSERDRATLQALYERPIGKRISGARSE